jgi:peptidoglycan/LPS O-acetylase OafA/YrhL
MIRYRADIDGLRAVAVIPVVLFHAGIPAFSGGFIGVDVFFVISGYVISLSLLSDVRDGKFSILSFYERRVRRIFPALFATLLVTYLYASLVFLPSHLKDLSESLVAATLFVSNIYFWKDSGYFAAEAVYRPLLHTWSLSVEEQFYIFMPIAIYVIARWFRSRWLPTLLPVLLMSLVLSVLATETAPTANFYLLPTRAWELLIGAMLALSPLPAIRRRAWRELLAAFGLVLILGPVFLYDEATPFPGLNALYPCLGTAIVIYSGIHARTAVGDILSVKPLVGVGLISYSLYLVHWPLVVFVNYQNLAPPTGWQVAGIVAASLLLAIFSWHFIEQPFRQRRPWITRPRLLTGGIVAMAAFATFGVVGVRAKGFPSRFPDFTQIEIAGHKEWRPGRCFLLGDPDYRRWKRDACTLTMGGPHRMLLWGDSFAAQYVPGIIANADRIDAMVLQYTGAGCPPILSYKSYARPRCTDFNANALNIIRQERIDTVVLAARWTDQQSRGLGELKSTLEALAGLGVDVYVIGQSPEFSMDVQVIAYRNGSRLADSTDSWDIFFDPDINAQLGEHSAGSRFIDPLAKICDGKSCIYRDKGVFLFEDYGHYSVDGSARAVKAYFPLVRHEQLVSDTVRGPR